METTIRFAPDVFIAVVVPPDAEPATPVWAIRAIAITLRLNIQEDKRLEL